MPSPSHGPERSRTATPLGEASPDNATRTVAVTTPSAVSTLQSAVFSAASKIPEGTADHCTEPTPEATVAGVVAPRSPPAASA
jgi:hypothetical protein